MTDRDPRATPVGMEVLSALASHAAVAGLARALAEGRRVVADGSAGSSTHLIAAAVAQHTGAMVMLVAAHLDEADAACDEIEAVGVRAMRFPALEALPGETSASLDLFAERLVACGRIEAWAPDAGPMVVVAPIQALMQSVPTAERRSKLMVRVRRGHDTSMPDFVRWLEASGYSRTAAVEEPGDFAVRGGIVDVFPPAASGGRAAPVRLDFFGDTVEKITEIDLDTMGSDRAIDAVELIAADENAARGDDGVNVIELLPAGAIALIAETSEVVEQARGYYERVHDSRGIFGPPAVLAALQQRCRALAEVNRFSPGSAKADERVRLPASPLPPFDRDASAATAQLVELARTARVLVTCQNEGEQQRFGELHAQFAAGAPLGSLVAFLHEGFLWDEGSGAAVALVPYHELLNRFTVRRRGGAPAGGAGVRAMDTFLDLAVGDYVVHGEHGIARLAALTMLEPRALPGAAGPGRKDRGEPEEHLTLEFSGGSKLHVPASQIDVVQKYVGGSGGKPTLSTLGGQRWKAQKDRVAQSVQDLAAELLRVRAARETLPGIAYPDDTAWQREFEAEFPYDETEDQLAALAAIKEDMGKHRPMDRLVCGDVGFGKTELAIRAAFKAVEFGKQAAVLVPTTVLAEQHERTFRSRFAGYPFRVEAVSRFRGEKETREVLTELRRGRVDVIIGTHRLLSDDVEFADLGLVVVDEEQRFGVEHKERLLRLRLTADVLTLSATPIPRTLHISLLGLRDISNLTTAPVDRRAIVTEVLPYNQIRVRRAIERELSREGQVFYVHNRVHSIRAAADRVAAMAPGAKIVIGHGQMPGHELEDVMRQFIRGEADILVSTTIIESGIDIPTANTMIIEDADRFGLSELHQLRGRVGRSKHRAYCYLLLPEDRVPTEIARKRLRAIEQYSMLGAGFKIAMRDLEIRGAGNILGPEQSGHIAAVGYEMYCRLLEDSVRNLKNEQPPPRPSATTIEIGVSASIPRAYIPSDSRRLEAYRRLATAPSTAELDRVLSDLRAAYGDPPRPVVRLAHLAELRIACAGLGVRSVSVRDKDAVFVTSKAKALADRLGRAPPGLSKAIDATVTVLPGKHNGELAEVYFRAPPKYMEAETLLAVLRKRLCAESA